MPPANRLTCRHCQTDQYPTRRGLERHENSCLTQHQRSLGRPSVAENASAIGRALLKIRFTVRVRRESPPPTIATEQQSGNTLWDQVRYTSLFFHALNLI